MALPLISVLHPTARVAPSATFPRAWRDACDAWYQRAAHPENIEYVISVHESRWREFWGHTWDSAGPNGIRRVEVIGDDYSPERLIHFPGFGYAKDALKSDPRPGGAGAVKIVKNCGRDSVVDQTNAAFRACSGTLITGAADDYYPPQNWDDALLEALPCPHCGRPRGATQKPDVCGICHCCQVVYDYTEREAVIVASTGAEWERERELMIGGAATRAVFERRGYILDPEFESMFSDNWWAFENRRDAAAGLLKIYECPWIQFEHRHPIFGKNELDDVYRLQNRPEAYKQGQATFMRKAFGTQVLYACCPGDWFTAEWVWPMFDLLLQLNIGNRFMVAPIGGHTSNVYCTRYEMAEAALGSAPSPDLVLWVDDDNLLRIDQFDLLYQDLVNRPDLSGVVGWCWCDNDGRPDPKTGEPRPWMMSVGRQGEDLACYRMTQADLKKAQESGDYLITSDDLEPHAFWSGFPVVLMRGAALRELGAQAFAPIVDPRVKFGFTSEDTSFFINARKAGQKWAVDLRVKVPHAKIRAIEPFQVLDAANQAEYLESKGLTLVPKEDPVSSAAD